MSNVLNFTRQAARNITSASSSLLCAATLIASLNSDSANAATENYPPTPADFFLDKKLSFGTDLNSIITTTTTNTTSYDYFGAGGYAYQESGHFAVLEEDTIFTPGFWAEVKQAQQTRLAEGQAFADTIITRLSNDAHGNTTFRINAPDAANMSIHTPFTGQQVRDGSDTYIVEGALGQEVLTFKALDTTQYEGVQVRPHPQGTYEVGEVFNLGEAVAEGKRKVSENARLFVTEKELNVGIGFPIFEAGDTVQGATLLIENAAGETKTFDVSDYIMDAQRMADLNVTVGGDGKTLPDDYLVVAITEGSDEVLSQIHTALAQPGAAMRFVAESQMGARFTTPAIGFGEEWANDVNLGTQQIANGADYALPLSKEFAVIATVGLTAENSIDHELASCGILQIDAEQIANYDYYLGNLDAFSGPFPRDRNVIFATTQGTNNVIAVGSPYMWGVNVEDALTGGSEGVKWALTGSFENVALTMTPEDLRQLSSGCTVDNNGTTPTPTSTTYIPGGPQTSTRLTTGGYDLGGGGSWNFGGGGTTTTTTTTTTTVPPISAVPLTDAQKNYLTALAALALLGAAQAISRRRNPIVASNDHTDTPHVSALDTFMHRDMA